MKSFVALNFIAGFLHYLYLVVASRQLPAVEFSGLSAWLAYLAFAYVGAGILQYLSCFVPLSRAHLRLLVTGGLAYAAVVTTVAFTIGLDHTAIGALAGILACVFGIFLGQAQLRLLFWGMSAGNLAVGLLKLGFALVLPFELVERYYWAVPLAYAPATLLMSLVLLRHEAEAPKGDGARGAILSTVVLGMGSALFPQFELMLMRSTQTPEVFQSFARLSLFYKAIFFVFLIFSQWLLPYQLRSPARAQKALADLRLYVGALGLAALGAGLGPLVATSILGWTEAPSWLHILLSCWNMGLLTWIFLLLQDLCAKRRNGAAVRLLAGVFVAALVQLGFGASVEIYFVSAILWNTLLIGLTVTSSGARNPKPSSPANAT